MCVKVKVYTTLVGNCMLYPMPGYGPLCQPGADRGVVG